MGKLLEKKRVWFWLYVAAELTGIVVAVILAIAVVLNSSAMLALFTVLTVVIGIYIYVYYAYRLLYLYQGTPDRTKWTVFMIIVIASNWLDGIPVLGMAVSIAGFVLAVACLIHDYKLVTAPE